jgi:ribosomal protein L37E
MKQSRFNPNRTVEMKCSRCGFTFDKAQKFCPLCGAVSDTSMPQKEPQSVSREDQSARDYPLSAFLDTIQESFFKTDHFFSKIQNSSNKSALLYGLLCGSIGIVSTFLWSLILPDSFKQISTTETAKNLIFTPFILILQILLTTAYVHFLLLISKSRKAPIGTTFKISCYSLGALVLNVIPAVGTFLAFITWFYLIITGIHQIHHLSKLKAFVIMIFPVLFLFMAVFFIAIIAGSIAALNLFT